MKIEIDLNEIFSEENENETWQESVKRQVVEKITNIIHSGVSKKLDQQISEIINTELTTAVKAQMPDIIFDLFAAQYTPIDRFGSKQEPTTFRKELIKTINEQMVYKAARWDSDKNAFTKAVDDTVQTNLQTFQKEFVRLVDGELVKEAMEYATKKLSERLGVK